MTEVASVSSRVDRVTIFNYNHLLLNMLMEQPRKTQESYEINLMRRRGEGSVTDISMTLFPDGKGMVISREGSGIIMNSLGDGFDGFVSVQGEEGVIDMPNGKVLIDLGPDRWAIFSKKLVEQGRLIIKDRVYSVVMPEDEEEIEEIDLDDEGTEDSDLDENAETQAFDSFDPDDTEKKPPDYKDSDPSGRKIPYPDDLFKK